MMAFKNGQTSDVSHQVKGLTIIAKAGDYTDSIEIDLEIQRRKANLKTVTI
jgi:hypothetical protein